MTPKTSLFHASFDGLKKKPGSVVLATFSFWMLCIVAIVPCLITPLLLFITVPFLFAPALYQYLVILGGLSQDDSFGLESKTSWAFFSRYFAPQFRGCFRFSMGLMKGLAAFWVATIFVIPSFVSIAPSIWSDFNAELETMTNLMQTENMGKVVAYLNGSSTLLSALGISTLLAFFFGFIFFFHNTLLYGMNVYSRSVFQLSMPGAMNLVYRDAIRGNRSFRKTYWQTFWPIYVLATVGFFLGGYLGFVLAPSYAGLYLALALALSLTFAMLYFPFYGAGVGLYFGTFRFDLGEKMHQKLEQSLNELKRTHQASEAEIAAMEETVKQFGEALKKKDAEEEKKEESPSENSEEKK